MMQYFGIDQFVPLSYTSLTHSDTCFSYNEALLKTRVLVEQTFGILKRRFPCLSYGLRVSPDAACEVVSSCVVQHNKGLNRGDVYCRATDVQREPPAHNIVHNGETGAVFRDIFAATYFG